HPTCRKRIHRLENRPAHLHPCVFHPTRSPTRSFSIPPTHLWPHPYVFSPTCSLMAPSAHFRAHPLVYGITRPSLAPPAHLWPHPLVPDPTRSFIPPLYNIKLWAAVGCCGLLYSAPQQFSSCEQLSTLDLSVKLWGCPAPHSSCQFADD
ncbi:hypothetical protein PAXRUDRAFT_831343, partial [Paxillus rubicundulus Ve08.2h10]